MAGREGEGLWNIDLACHGDEAVLELPHLPARTCGDLDAQGAKGIISGDLLSQLIKEGTSRRNTGR
jgi:hypothetical protein